MYDAFKDDHTTTLFDSKNVAFGRGIVIVTAHFPEGLEFEKIIGVF